MFLRVLTSSRALLFKFFYTQSDSVTVIDPTTLRPQRSMKPARTPALPAALTLTLTLTLTLALTAAAETYSDQYDNMNLDEILRSERLLNGYVACLMDVGPCTPDAKELKKNIPEAIDNGCDKCTAKQKEGSAKVMEYIIDHRPEDWVRFEKKYDPSGSYKMKYFERKKSENNMGDAKADEASSGPPQPEGTPESA